MPFSEAFPIFETGDAARAAGFYCEHLGFEEHYRFPADGPPEFVVVVLGPLSLGLSAVEDPGLPGRASLWLYTDDVDGEVERLRNAGIAVTREPEDQEWGERMAAVVDPGRERDPDRPAAGARRLELAFHDDLAAVDR